MPSVRFTLMGDFHYCQLMYPVEVRDLQVILEDAHTKHTDFLLHTGDFCNDYLGSREITRALLENPYGIAVYGVAGNHEMEYSYSVDAPQPLSYVFSCLTNRRDAVVWGTEDGRFGDGTRGYYYFDRNGFRVIALDTYHSLDPQTGIYEHYPTLVAREGTEGRELLGEPQFRWLSEVLENAADQHLHCIVLHHAGFSPEWAAAPDAARVRELYRAVNARQAHTVMLDINGHLHTDHHTVFENVVYFDVNAVLNGCWRGKDFHPYPPAMTYSYTPYDGEGYPLGEPYERCYAELWQSPRNAVFDRPLFTTVTVTDDGTVTAEEATVNWKPYRNLPALHSGEGPKICGFTAKL